MEKVERYISNGIRRMKYQYKNLDILSTPEGIERLRELFREEINRMEETVGVKTRCEIFYTGSSTKFDASKFRIVPSGYNKAYKNGKVYDEYLTLSAYAEFSAKSLGIYSSTVKRHLKNGRPKYAHSRVFTDDGNVYTLIKAYKYFQEKYVFSMPYNLFKAHIRRYQLQYEDDIVKQFELKRKNSIFITLKTLLHDARIYFSTRFKRTEVNFEEA